MTSPITPARVVARYDGLLEQAIREAVEEYGSPGNPTNRAMITRHLHAVVTKQRRDLVGYKFDYLNSVYPDLTPADILPEYYPDSATRVVVERTFNRQAEAYASTDMMNLADRRARASLPPALMEEKEATEKFIKETTRALGQHTRAPAREAVSKTAHSHGDGWTRVLVGKSCGFCAMLTSRGAVYNKKSVKFRSHPSCDCTAAVVKGGIYGDWEGREDQEKLEAAWRAIHKKYGGDKEKNKEAMKKFDKYYQWWSGQQ